MRIHFHGAVNTVTGSLHILETSRGEQVLLDCGLFQGRRQEAQERNRTLPIAPDKVRAVVISHAHVDHIGNLPTWYAQGLRCPVHATAATADLGAILLRDCAHIQLVDALFVNKHIRKNGRDPVQPLYTPEIAEAAIGLLHPHRYGEWFEILPGLRVFYREAGHILGSANVTIEEATNGTRHRVCFTGDLGRPDTPILRDPEPFAAGADIVITESTYGNKDHAPQDELPEALRRIIYQTVARGGRVLIPAFAVGRTQSILFALRQLQKAGKLPEVPVYLDSPLAQSATEVFRKHAECFDESARQALKEDGELFAVEGYKALRTKEDSQSLNEKHESCIVIAGSGMCEAGRILHHLRHGLSDPRNTVLIVGFQAENTLGWRLVNGVKAVRVFGQEMQVRAEVLSLNGFSAHAGQHELGSFLDRGRPAGPLFLVHGEVSRVQAFKTFLDGQGFTDVRIPTQGEIFKL
jgi:metallo-beta-lactamase family protein